MLEIGVPQLSLHSPVGDLTLSQEDDSLVALDWGWGRDQGDSELLREARQQLHDYFDGKRAGFDLKLNPMGTQYQKRVWNALIAIPPGETRTYATLAGIAGGSARAIGGAMARNPLPILIPCHRIVASSGPGGYSGGDGLPTKFYLLALERRHQPLSTLSQPLLELS
jgi:methylated-DNA-[protein]-cysteine S-methyltransferase